MKLPEPDTHCYDDDTQKDVWSYSKELVEQMLAQADKDFSDGMMVVHLQVVDQMQRRYEPVLKMALEALEGADQIDTDMRDAINSILKVLEMSKPASNQTRLHQAKAIARHRKQQEQRAIEQMVTDTPNRAQRRGKK